MRLPEMLDHDYSRYEKIFGRIVEISRAWAGTKDAMLAQLGPLTEIWDRLPAGPSHALPRSITAHLLADLQPDAADELHWDLESLRCLEPVWTQAADPRLFNAARYSLPSIYYSLAGASRRLGDRDAAREYVRRAALLSPVLLPGAYTDRLVAAINRMERSLDAVR